MQLVPLWALLVLTGADPMAIEQEARRDRAPPLPPEVVERQYREAILRVMETVPWAATAVDVDRRTLSALALSSNEGVSVEDPGDPVRANPKLDRLPAHMTLDRFPVAADAKVVIDGAGGELKDLKRSMRLMVVLSKDKSSLVRIEAVTDARAVLKLIDAGKKTITVTLQGKEWVLALADGVLVYAEGEGARCTGRCSSSRT